MHSYSSWDITYSLCGCTVWNWQGLLLYVQSCINISSQMYFETLIHLLEACSSSKEQWTDTSTDKSWYVIASDIQNTKPGKQNHKTGNRIKEHSKNLKRDEMQELSQSWMDYRLHDHSSFFSMSWAFLLHCNVQNYLVHVKFNIYRSLFIWT